MIGKEDTMELKDKLVVVVGLGRRTGVETVKFLDAAGAQVIVTDTKDQGELKEEIKALADCQVQFDLGGHSLNLILQSDLIIISPGVPVDIPLLVKARAEEIEIISEIELAYRYCKAPIVAITGTNGKTTTTTLIGQIFNATGRHTVVGGNIGRALIADVPQLEREDLVIAEISSFQLEAIKSFKPQISLFLNITPDHLDRHGSFDEYLKAKRRMAINQDQGDYAILNYDDPLVREFGEYTNANVVFFSQKTKLDLPGVYLEENKIVSNLSGKLEEIIDVDQIRIKGPHNLENALGAVAVGLLLKVDRKVLVQKLKEFSGVEHRIEDVAVIDGVRFINDSKGTNPIAAIKALETFEPPIILIAGGKDKNSDFDDFAQVAVKKVKAMVLLGETAEMIDSSLREFGYEAIHHVNTLENSVKVAKDLAAGEGIVLLSPACASWDMFNNYEERGELFKETVRALESSKEQ